METVGQRLRRLRIEGHFSQRDLAGPGVSYAYISRIEADARRPSVKALRLLAEKLGVSVEYLETGTDNTATDALLANLRERLGPGAELQIDCLLHVGGHPWAEVTWRRAAGEKWKKRGGETITVALREVLEYEDAVDRLEADRVRLASEERRLASLTSSAA